MHAEAFTETAAKLFALFSRFKEFYLVGGTALALQLGHRKSVDFDFFTEKELPANLLQRVKRAFPSSPIAVTYRAFEQLNLTISGIKTTFFYFAYPVIEPLIMYRGNKIASVHEIAAMKAFALGQRLAYKDYVDWYFMLKGKYVTLEAVIALAKKKFGGEFNDRLFLGQIVSFDDVPTQEIDFLGDFLDRTTIAAFLTKEVRNFQI